MKKLIIVFLSILTIICGSIAFIACNASYNEPYYGTYQATSSLAGDNITIDRKEFKFGNGIAQNYTFDESRNVINVEGSAMKFSLYNNYTVIASAPVLWNTFEFNDNYDGTVNMRCVAYGSGFEVKTVITAREDGSYSYIDYDYSIFEQGDYRYKNGFLKLDKDLALGATYISGRVMYTAVWINNYDNFWDDNLTPVIPHEHNYSNVSTVEPTCAGQGYILYTCACGDSYKENIVNLLGHNYKDGYCERCGEQKPTLEYLEFFNGDNNDLWVSCSESGLSAKEIIIPSVYNGYLVTSILEFSYCINLTSITIPNSVTSIHSSAFFRCSSLKNITIPDSVTEIGGRTFEDCSSLTSITIPDSVTEIGYNAFMRCTSLTNITIPDSVTEIGYSAFEDCSSLTSITIPDSVTVISSSAFEFCRSLTNITIPDGVTEIGDSAFRWCDSLTNITIPNKVTVINSSVFEGCSSFTSITIPDGVTEIGKHAFESCSNLTSITIPDSVTYIDDYAFRWCTGLTSITIPDGVTEIGDSVFWWCPNLTNITIPNSVTVIGSSAFETSGLTSITIPDSVIEIKDRAFNCYNLENITVSAGNKVYKSENNCILTKDGSTVVVGCKNSVIPNSVTNIGDYAFYDCSLTSITIPDGVTDIGKSAFDNCSSLTSIIIPNSVTNIGDNAFWRGGSFTVYYCGTAEDWAKVIVNEGSDYLAIATFYYYSETEPELNSEGTNYNGNHWHYGTDGKTPVVWKKENQIKGGLL